MFVALLEITVTLVWLFKCAYPKRLLVADLASSLPRVESSTALRQFNGASSIPLL